MSWPPTPQPMGSMIDVMGIGEVMLLLQAEPPETLTSADHLAIGVAGAEYNVCAAVARLGGRTSLLTRLGQDSPGERVLQAAADMGIETDKIQMDSSRSTGLFLRETPPDGSRTVIYFRQGSAASVMDSTDATRVWSSAGPRTVILSGITAALGPGPRELVYTIATEAKARGAAVVVDVNLRANLGQFGDAVSTIREILPLTDLLVLGDDESTELFDSDDPQAVFMAAARAGVSETVLKGGPRGCWYTSETHDPVWLPSRATKVVDPVGAGDAFLGGYVAGRLVGASSKGSAYLGSELAASVISELGDVVGLPSSRTAKDLLAETKRH